MEFEQEQFTRLQRLKTCRRRCPEVYFRQIVFPAQEFRPVAIGNRYDETHTHE
jgi:hypothetical protein